MNSSGYSSPLAARTVVFCFLVLSYYVFFLSDLAIVVVFIDDSFFFAGVGSGY